MEHPVDTTIQTYQQNFAKYVERTPAVVSGEFKVWLDSFLSQIPKHGSIFEVGSAAGRDARYLLARGYKVFCADVIPDALQELSSEGFETAVFDFRDMPKKSWLGKFDAFFANAVFLHAPQAVFETALKNTIAVLKKGGHGAFTLKAGEGEEITSNKMDAPRYFRYHTESEVREILSKFPLDVVDISHLEQGKWLHVIVKKR